MKGAKVRVEPKPFIQHS